MKYLPLQLEAWSGICVQAPNFEAIQRAFEENTDPLLSIRNPYTCVQIPNFEAIQHAIKENTTLSPTTKDTHTNAPH